MKVFALILATVLCVQANNPEVTTSVTTDKPNVLITCQLSGDVEVTGCRFQNPRGQELLATQVAEERYTFTNEQLESNAGQSCGLLIADPLTSDLGIWRCAVDTVDRTYFGFVSVLCPWAMSVPEIAATVVTEPTLTTTTQTVSVVEGNVASLSCSVQAPIRYCYFRMQNGSVLSVSPGTTGSFQYAGAGLDSGECGISFPAGLQPRDSGNWRCQVGFNDPSEPEQRADITVAVEALMIADQYHKENPEETLVVYAQVHSRSALEYCRFVRMDGIGFTTSNVLENYEDHSVISNGHCEIHIHHPNILEQHPWTVIAKIVGQDVEISRTTEHTIDVPNPHEPQPEQEPQEPLPEFEVIFYSKGGYIALWICMSMTMLLCIFGILSGSKRSREWARRNANQLGNSFRSSIAKPPLPADDRSPPNYTPNIA